MLAELSSDNLPLLEKSLLVGALHEPRWRTTRTSSSSEILDLIVSQFLASLDAPLAVAVSHYRQTSQMDRLLMALEESGIIPRTLARGSLQLPKRLIAPLWLMPGSLPTKLPGP